MIFFFLCFSLLHYGQMQQYTNAENVSEAVNQCCCHPHRKIVAEYEKTVAQMIGELVSPSGHSHAWMNTFQARPKILYKP